MSELKIKKTDSGYILESTRPSGVTTELLHLPTEDRAESAAILLAENSNGYFRFRQFRQS